MRRSTDRPVNPGHRSRGFPLAALAATSPSMGRLGQWPTVRATSRRLGRWPSRPLAAQRTASASRLRPRVQWQTDEGAIGEFQVTLGNLHLAFAARAAFDHQLGPDREPAGQTRTRRHDTLLKTPASWQDNVNDVLKFPAAAGLSSLSPDTYGLPMAEAVFRPISRRQTRRDRTSGPISGFKRAF